MACVISFLGRLRRLKGPELITRVEFAFAAFVGTVVQIGVWREGKKTLGLAKSTV